MNYCRVCNHPIDPFMTFGRMPIANAFLNKDQFDDEYFFELMPASCHNCTTFQIVNVPEPNKMFHDHYAYFASTSSIMTKHFEKLAKDVIKKYLNSNDPFVVEIGSNDGISLKNYSDAAIRHLGVDPSYNVVNASRSKGISAICSFFNRTTADEIIENHGKADIIISTNTMHHIADIKEVVAGAKILLKKKGLMITEDPYLGEMIKLNSFEQIYAEHNFIWSLMSMEYLFNLYDMEIIDVSPNDHHGGCMRYFIGHKGEHSKKEVVINQFQNEKLMGIKNPEIFDKFRKDCEKSRDTLMEFLLDLRAKQKRIVGYGATAKSSTLINYCGITSDHIDFICDTTLSKQGKFSPGAHIPILPHKDFISNYPDYTLLFAWNHKDEILSKENKYTENEGKWIEYIPDVRIS